MATLPEPYIYDVAGGIRAHQSGFNLGQQQRQNALAQRAGGMAASGDLGSAANALLEGGDLQGGFGIQDRVRAMAKDADEQALAKSQRANDAFFRVAMLADTPEKWGMAINQLRGMGIDTKGFDDFGSREMALGRFGQTRDVIGTVLEERKARAISGALMPQGGQPAGVDDRYMDRRPTRANAANNGYDTEAFIKQQEGFAPIAKWDVRQNSGGYGTRAQPGETFTEASATARLRQEIAPINAWIDQNIKVPLTPGQRTALTSFAFNLGVDDLQKLLPDINAGNWQNVAARMSTFNKALNEKTGQLEVLNGLTDRRGREAALVLGQGATPQRNALAPQPQQPVRTAGLDYDAGIRAAVQMGDYETASRIQALKTGGTRSQGRIQEVNGRLVAEQPDGTFKEVYAAPPKAKNLTVQEQKEVFEADEGVQAATNVIGALNKALDLNDKAYSGPMAQTRGYGMSLFGSEGGTATEELQNVVLQQVLDNLKATFGAAPTEGERQILVDIQGSVNKAPEVRKRIFENAIAAAERRRKFSAGKAEAIRGGEYFQPGYSPQSAPSAPSEPDRSADRRPTRENAGQGPQTVNQQQYQSLPKGAQYIAEGDPERKVRIKQ